jgi:DNA-binding response OmpR family regulator
VATVTRHAWRRVAPRPQPHALASSSGRPRGGRRSEASTSGRHDASRQSELRRRILVIDDEPSIRLLTRVNLGASGIEVLEASDGQAGVELARREHPDLVLLDVMMPGVDGWDVARQLGDDEATAEIPIVFLTARAEQADRVQGGELGGVAYLLKPFDPVSLADVLEGILERVERGEREQLRDEMTRPRHSEP